MDLRDQMDAVSVPASQRGKLGPDADQAGELVSKGSQVKHKVCNKYGPLSGLTAFVSAVLRSSPVTE